MDFSYSWEPDPAQEGLLIQLPGCFCTVNSLSLLFSLPCSGVSLRRAVEISSGCYHSCTEGCAGTWFIKNIFSRFIIAMKFSPLAKTWHWHFSRAPRTLFLGNFEENRHTPHAVFKSRNFRGQTGLGSCNWGLGPFLQCPQHRLPCQTQASPKGTLIIYPPLGSGTTLI